MGLWVFGILLGLVALGVDGYPAGDLILRLPGQPSVGFRQFSGYVDVDKMTGRSLFYYFVEAEGNSEKKPLTLWLNGVNKSSLQLKLLGSSGIYKVSEPVQGRVLELRGRPNFCATVPHWRVSVIFMSSLCGYRFHYCMVEPRIVSVRGVLSPGCSSLGGGAFTELGPFFPRGDGRGLRRNKSSWNKASNLLFVESPAGVGWSYSNTTSDYNTGDAATANDMYLFLLGWYKKFPEFKSRDLFLTGESYAGHYIPQLAYVLLNHNKNSTGFKFNIKGVAIGNPLLKLDRDIPSIYEYFWTHGMISDEIHLAITNLCNFENYVFPRPHNVTTECNNAIAEANAVVGDYINTYYVIVDVCYPEIAQQELRLRKFATRISLGVDVCINQELRLYMNLPEVQHTLHANRTSLPYNWTICSSILNYNLSDANTNILPLLKTIVQNGVPVWVFSGDQDAIVSLTGSRTIMREVAQDLKFNMTVPYSAWFYKGQVGGWATEYGNLLTFATVRGAAHMVPYTQPERALLLFESFLSGKRLPNTTYPSIN